MNITDEGRVALVSADGHLITEAIAESAEHQAALDGEAYIVNCTITDDTLTTTATGGFMLYLRNLRSDKYLEVTKIEASAAVAGGVLVAVVDPVEGTLAANAVTTPVSLNRERVVSADVECNCWDESGHGMTGLTGGTILKTTILAVGKSSVDLDGSVMLGLNDSIVVSFSGAAGEFECSIRYHFRRKTTV